MPSSSWGDVSAEEREGRWPAAAASAERAGGTRQARPKAKKLFAEKFTKKYSFDENFVPPPQKIFSPKTLRKVKNFLPLLDICHFFVAKVEINRIYGKKSRIWLIPSAPFAFSTEQSHHDSGTCFALVLGLCFA